MLMRLAAALTIALTAGTAAGDFQTTDWEHQVTVQTTLNDDFGIGSLPSQLDLVESGVTVGSTLSGASLEFAHIFSLSTVSSEATGLGASTFQGIEFEVDAPTPVYAHGFMGGAGSFELSWSLSIRVPGDVLGTWDYDQLAGEILASDPQFYLGVSSATIVLLPGERYRFTSSGELHTDDVAASGEMYLTAMVPSPKSAVLGLMGLAMLGGRRSLFR